SIGFSGDGSEIWLRGGPDRKVRLMPLMGGEPRPFLDQSDHYPVVSVSWSPDQTKVVYHKGLPGDPMFVADRSGANPRQIYVDPNSGGHCHCPAWSADGKWIYFVRSGTATDLWRISPSGGQPERLTYHNSSLGCPAPISPKTVLYVAPARDG